MPAADYGCTPPIGSLADGAGCAVSEFAVGVVLVGVGVVGVGVGVVGVGVGVGVEVVNVGVGLALVGVTDVLAVGAGAGVLPLLAAQIAPPARPRIAARMTPPMIQPFAEFFSGGGYGSSGSIGPPGTGG